jgi:hypothetical protein
MASPSSSVVRELNTGIVKDVTAVSLPPIVMRWWTAAIPDFELDGWRRQRLDADATTNPIVAYRFTKRIARVPSGRHDVRTTNDAGEPRFDVRDGRLV